MALQNTFYVVGIIAMTLYTLLLIAIVILLFYIKNKLSEVFEKIERQFDLAKNIVTHPQEAAVVLGVSAAKLVFGQIINLFRRKKEA